MGERSFGGRRAGASRPSTRPIDLLFLSASLGAATVSSSAFAQTGPAAGGVAGAVDEVVVTAQRRDENVQDVPITIQVYSGKNLNDLGLRSTADLGAVTPNVQITLPYGVGGQPLTTIRGIGLNDFGAVNAGPNGIYLDEVYLSVPASQTLQMFDLSRVEVLEGPQGTLYGKNTTGGAINMVSAKPSATPSADVRLSYASYNTVNLEVAVNGPITPTLAGRVAFVENYSSGYMHNVTLNKNNYGQNYGVRGALLWTPSPSLKVQLNVHGGQVDNPSPGYRHLGSFVPGTQGFTPVHCTVQQTNAGQCVDLFGYSNAGGFYKEASSQRNILRVNSVGGYLRADYSSGSITLVSLTGIEHLDKNDPESFDGSPNRLLDTQIKTNASTISQEFRVSQETERYNWIAGAIYSHDALRLDQPIQIFMDFDKFFGFGSGDQVASNQLEAAKQDTDSAAVYGQGEYRLTPALRLIAGGRVTTERKTFHYNGAIQFQEGGAGNLGPILPLAVAVRSLRNSAFTWKLGLDYAITKDVMTYATVSTGWKGGIFNDGYLSANATEILRQLNPVRPERVTAYEVGIKTSFFDHRLVANVAAFYNDYKDEQVFVLVPPIPGGSGGPVSVLDNAKRAHTQGFDLMLSAVPVTGLTFTAKVGLLETKLDRFVSAADPSQADYSGNDLPFAPKVSTHLMAEYRHPIRGDQLNIQLSASYRSRQFYDTTNDPYIAQPGYWISNLRIAYELNHGRAELAAFVRNIANEKYDIDRFNLTQPFGFIQGIPGQPRLVGFEFSRHF